MAFPFLVQENQYEIAIVLLFPKSSYTTKQTNIGKYWLNIWSQLGARTD